MTVLSLLMAQVRFQVRELRSHKLHSVAKKKGITDKLRKERKCNHIIFSVKTTKGRKRLEDKNRKR